MHDLLKWLWNGNSCLETLVLRDIKLEECITNVKEYAKNNNWKCIKDKNLYNNNLDIFGISLSFLTNITTRRCRINVIVTESDEILNIELSSSTFLRRPSGDPKLNKRIIDGLKSYLTLVTKKNGTYKFPRRPQLPL